MHLKRGTFLVTTLEVFIKSEPIEILHFYKTFFI